MLQYIYYIFHVTLNMLQYSHYITHVTQTLYTLQTCYVVHVTKNLTLHSDIKHYRVTLFMLHCYITHDTLYACYTVLVT